MKDTPLYNSRIIKNFVEYINEHHPEVNTNVLLSYAGITTYQLEDGGHWFTQSQIDLFHEIMQQQIGVPNIAREVGRNTPFSKATSAVSQYALGFITPSVAYSMLGKLHVFFSRAVTVYTRNLGPNQIEILASPNPGVREKPFQCENRIGTFEAIAKLFTTKFASVEHPTCIHRGGDSCRYVISWEKTPSLVWKTIRNYVALSAFVVCPVLFLILHDTEWAWTVPVLLYVLLVSGFLYYSEHMEKSELAANLKSQGDLANTLLDEINIRYNNALLIQEIGQATAMILDSAKLLKLVMEAMANRFDFDRGMILLTNQEKTHLLYSAGYGYNPGHEEYLAGVEFHLDRPHSKGPAVESFRLQKPILIDDISQIENNLSKKSQVFAQMMGAKSFICVPIVFENESLGVLMVDNVKSKRHLRQSDVSLLMGIATQIAISINNATSYQRVLESEERFRSLSENAPDIIYTLDANCAFTYINPVWEKILGHRPDEVIGRNFVDFVRKEDSGEYIQLFEQIRDGQLILRDRVGTILHKDGSEKFFNISGAPNLDLKGNVTGIVGIFRDISEQKQLESQLLHAQKMEAVGTLAGGIAHDFNNLLTGIQGYASLMFLDMNITHPLYDKLKGIEDQVRSGAELTKQLLGFARGGKYEVSVTDMNEIINKTSSMFGRTKKEITIHRQYKDNIWAVEVDRGQIEQVLLNIYVNAWQAMPGGGDLYLETANVFLDEESARPYGVKPGRYVRVAVTDTGIGMDEQTRERIFEPFFTTKEMGRGTGLGLASVYGIVKGHNGIIDVYSEKGHGATFTIYLPASEKELVKEEKVATDIARGEGTILLVDDEDVIIDVGSEILEVLGYKVSVARSGREAIEKYKEMQNEIDMVILDMIMPEMDGGETFNALKSIDPGIKVILSSGYSADARSTRMMEQGCYGFIQKPYSVNTLSQKVREVLDKKI
ncbi:MAG: PAS domain S-box protein [Syntrophales bacterium]|jgi:PAS domain S-box-containing protein